MTTTLPALADPLAQLIALVTDSVSSPHSKRSYAASLRDFLTWLRPHGTISKALVARYRAELEERKLAPSSINVRLAAIRKLAREAGDNGMLDPQTAAAIQRVDGVRTLGTRLGHWLTLGEAQKLLDAPDRATLRGLRDRALLAVLLGCGLRRTEAVSLEFRHIQQREGRAVIVDLLGKGGRTRSVPAPAWAVAAIREWTEKAGLWEGRLFRGIDHDGRIAAGLTPQTLMQIVKKHAYAWGLKIAPHDLRRTYSKLAHQGGAPLEQIQLTLGHASVETTERYLSVDLNLQRAACDYVGLT